MLRRRTKNKFRPGSVLTFCIQPWNPSSATANLATSSKLRCPPRKRSSDRVSWVKEPLAVPSTTGWSSTCSLPRRPCLVKRTVCHAFNANWPSLLHSQTRNVQPCSQVIIPLHLRNYHYTHILFHRKLKAHLRFPRALGLHNRRYQRYSELKPIGLHTPPTWRNSTSLLAIKFVHTPMILVAKILENTLIETVANYCEFRPHRRRDSRRRRRCLLGIMWSTNKNRQCVIGFILIIKDRIHVRKTHETDTYVSTAGPVPRSYRISTEPFRSWIDRKSPPPSAEKPLYSRRPSFGLRDVITSTIWRRPVFQTAGDRQRLAAWRRLRGRYRSSLSDVDRRTAGMTGRPHGTTAFVLLSL